MSNSIKKRIFAFAAVAAIALQTPGFTALAANDNKKEQPAAASDSAEKAASKSGLTVGQTVQGFTVKKIKKYAMLQAEIVLLEHDKTGAKFMYIANDDTERSFTLGFRTVAEDETGKPHIFEHACLNGSDKYPANALFQISYQTYASFVNAFTMPTETVYPIASLSEKQLLKYADFYTDATFHPLILKNKDIYKQEGWRYRLEEEDGELSIEGTVYSEMLAATNITDRAMSSNYKTAFPGATTGNSYGGVPDHIPELTYEALRDYHAKYYHPSNCVATLYGKIDDFESFAKILDTEFSKYEKKGFSFAEKDYQPITGPVSSYTAFPAGETDDTSKQTIVYRDYILRDISLSDLRKVRLLVMVLNDANSPVITAVNKKFPQAQVGIACDSTGPEAMLSVVVQNVEKENGKTIAAIIDNALKQVAKDGIDDKTLEKIEHNIKVNNLLSGEGTNKGVMYSAQIVDDYATIGDIWNTIDANNSLDKISSFSKNGDFKDLLDKYVTNNDLTVLSVTYPEKGLLEKQEAARAQALADKKASLSKEEIKALVEDTKAFDTRIDADDSVKAAIVSKVKGVTLKELPEDIPDVKLTSKTNDKNVRTITASTDIDGIGKTMIALDISDLSIEEAMWVQLYAGLMFEADTFDHKASELKDMRDISLMNFYSGIGTCISKDKTDFTPALYVTWQSLDEDIDESFDVFGEVLTKTKTNQRARIVRAIENSKAGIKNELITGGKQTIKYGGISSKSGDNNYMYRVQGLEYYKFLDDVSAKLDSDPSYVIENLKNARKNLANSYGATFGYAGGANGIAAFEKRSAAFADSLANTPKTKAKYDKAALSDAYTVNSGANFNYKFMNYEDLGLGDITPEQIAEFDVVASMLSDAYTLPYLRNYYGAYGAYVDNTDNGIVFWTYRDPNIAETYAVYDALPEFLDTFEVDQETLDGYIMAQYSNLVQSSGNLSDAELTLNYAFDDRDINAEVAASLKALKKLTPERVNEIKAYYAKVAKEGRICTVGTAASVQANKDAFGKVENPFSE